MTCFTRALTSSNLICPDCRTEWASPDIPAGCVVVLPGRTRDTTSMEEAMSSAHATVAVTGYLAGTWKADPVHSEVAFSVRHLMISNIRGRFTSHEVTIVTSQDPRDSSVTATIDLASVDTGNATRDDHLRSADYLDVGRYPAMSYRSASIRQAGG